MSDEDEIERFDKFCASNHECKCLDGSFEDFNKCCGKKFGIKNPVDILFKKIEQMQKNHPAKRIRDMQPEEACKALEQIFNVLEKNDV